MKIVQLYLLSILGGVLLAMGWFPYGWTPLLFVGFVPLLTIEQIISTNHFRHKYLLLLGCTFTTFIIWNIITTWWVKNASLGGGAMAIIANTILMTFLFLLIHNVSNRIGRRWRSIVFICFWMSFEFYHLRWDLSWPWLTIGNGFANHPNWIQWYEYTGVFGGSLWVLVVNLMVAGFIGLKNNQDKKQIFKSLSFKKAKTLGVLIPLLALPFILSYTILHFRSDNEKEKVKVVVVVVQPNIDPYNEKFNVSFDTQLRKMLKLAALKTDSTTDYLLFPETAIQDNLWEGKLDQSASIQTLREFVMPFPKLKIIIGANSSRSFGKGETPSITARTFGDDTTTYYDDYNTAIQIDTSDSIQVYHKSRLVPGVEKMPFPFLFKYFEKYALSLGGTAGSYGTQDDRTNLVARDTKVKTAPVICYESIYGEFVSEYITNGAQFISIITNDGWWGDTPGYKQHLRFGALRAIETRKWIARSANTGISCFVSPMGEIQQATDYWKPAVIGQQIGLNNELTFYVRYGDYIARTAIYITLLLILYSWLIRFKVIPKQK